MPIRDTLLPEFDTEMATTRKVLERCPEDQYGFKPHEKSWTMAQLATHVANLARWAVITLEQGEFDYAPPGAPPIKEEPAASREELLKKFDGHVSAARAALEKA